MYNDLIKLRFPGFTTHSISELPSFDAVSKVHCNIGRQVKLSLLGLLPGSMYYLAALTCNLSHTSILFPLGTLSDWLFSLIDTYVQLHRHAQPAAPSSSQRATRSLATSFSPARNRQARRKGA